MRDTRKVIITNNTEIQNPKNCYEQLQVKILENLEVIG